MANTVISPIKKARLTSKEWRVYFEQHKLELSDIPWNLGGELTAYEKEMIRESVQTFQLGESSEGRHLLKCAKEYTEQTGDLEYVTALKLFIQEEQRHARLLGRFLEINGLPVIKKALTDSVFRNLRHLANLEVSIFVLLTAEIIAQIYYPALQKATSSVVLRSLCQQITIDEEAHIRFQTERLAILRQNCHPELLLLIHGFHRIFFWVTWLVVWFGHKKVLKAGGLTRGRYRREAARYLEIAMRHMNPKREKDSETR